MVRKSRISTGILAGALLAATSGAAFAGADLVPDAGSLLTGGEAAVVNNGDAASGPSHLIIVCKKTSGPGGCAEDAGMAAYTNPAYPNAVVIDVPALEPGESYGHVLAFWDDLDWPVGTFKLTLTADAGNAVAEDSERNNKTSATKMELALTAPDQKPKLNKITSQP